MSSLAAPERTVTVGIRSEHLILNSVSSQREPAIDAKVMRIERLSDQHLVHVCINGSEQELVCTSTASSELELGSAVRMQVQQAFWFDADGQRIQA
jgi:multiple sugar transport system ATP-binding protein